MGGVIAVLFGWIKLKNQKIENLEEENIMFQKKGHITDEMNEAKKQAEVKREEAIKDINTDNWRDSI